MIPSIHIHFIVVLLIQRQRKFIFSFAPFFAVDVSNLTQLTLLLIQYTELHYHEKWQNEKKWNELKWKWEDKKKKFKVKCKKKTQNCHSKQVRVNEEAILVHMTIRIDKLVVMNCWMYRIQFFFVSCCCYFRTCQWMYISQ